MHTEISYKGRTDEEAIADIREWCSERQWEALLRLAQAIELGESAPSTLDFAFGIVGISGFPVRAFARKYCPKALEAE